MVLIAGAVVGSLGGGFVSDHLAAKNPGKRLMLCVPAGLVALLAGIALGFVSAPSAALICLALLQASILLVMGMGTIALQAIAPANVRGSMTAILTTCASLVGALAPTAIGLLNDQIFGSGAGIVNSVTLFFSLMLALALLLLLHAQRGFATLVRSREELSTQ
jgi:MFS family permease